MLNLFEPKYQRGTIWTRRHGIIAVAFLIAISIIVPLLLFNSFTADASPEDKSDSRAKNEQSADTLLNKIGVSRGICVVLGDTKLELALELARKSELLIYVQLPKATDVEKARQAADAAGLYGTRIYVEKGALTSLYLADNLADVLIAVGEAAKIAESEALRILRPEGKALLGGKELIKSFPPGVDDWSHPYHGPDNNPQSKDRIARAPYLTQFLTDPRYAPVPQVAVASAGRVFKAFGHVAFKKREEPYLNKLIAFNPVHNGKLASLCYDLSNNHQQC